MKLYRVLFTVIVSFVFALVIAFLLLPKETDAERDVTDFQSLLQRVSEDLRENPDFLVAIRFHTPLGREGDPVWILPTRIDQEEPVSTYISEIGEDFVCFTSTGAGTRYHECVLFSNIAGIWYLVD